MTYDDHHTGAPRQSPRHPPNWARLGGIVGFLAGVAVAVAPVAAHMENLLLRVTLMVVGGVIWAVSAVVVIWSTRRSTR